MERQNIQYVQAKASLALSLASTAITTTRCRVPQPVSVAVAIHSTVSVRHTLTLTHPSLRTAQPVRCITRRTARLLQRACSAHGEGSGGTRVGEQRQHNAVRSSPVVVRRHAHARRASDPAVYKLATERRSVKNRTRPDGAITRHRY